MFADEWLEDIERVLRVARLLDDLKIEAAGLQLHDLARTWFRNEPKLVDPDLIWEKFRKQFKKFFFLFVAKEMLER